MDATRNTPHASRDTPHASRFIALPLLLLPLILLAPLVFGGRALYWGVPLMQFYPWQHFAVETWRLGEVPLWNPLVGGGAPLAANLQTGVFYPLNALYLILPTEIAMGYTAALHVMLAGLFMFAFVRSIGLRPLPALIAAVAFQLSGFLIARLGFLSITVTFPWVAAWLWRAERAMQSGRMRDALWLAIGIGSGLLAGHAQIAAYGMILLAAYTLYRSFIARRQFALLVVGSGVLLGIGLAAIQLLPAAELARESQRAQGLDYDFAMTHSYWPWRLLTLVTPDLFGNPAYGNFWGYDNYWENAAYIGLLPLALVGVAVREWGRRFRNKRVGVWGYGSIAPGASSSDLQSFDPSAAPSTSLRARLRAGFAQDKFCEAISSTTQAEIASSHLSRPVTTRFMLLAMTAEQ
ncbi:MAG: hypothetical protein ACRDGG_03215 [Anaerolineae bacterium]